MTKKIVFRDTLRAIPLHCLLVYALRAIDELQIKYQQITDNIGLQLRGETFRDEV